jgi:hypothetical protein
MGILAVMPAANSGVVRLEAGHDREPSARPATAHFRK